jgi:hypothetical protein
MARRILDGRAKGAWAAADQLEREFPDGRSRVRGAVAQRLYRKFNRHEQWFLEQATIRPRPPRRRRHGLSVFLDSMAETQRFIEQQQMAIAQQQQMVNEVNRTVELYKSIGRMFKAGLPED